MYATLICVVSSWFLSFAVFLLATALWCKSSLLAEILKPAPVLLKTELKKTTVVLEDSRESSLQRDGKERISLAEVGHRREVRTRKGGVELRESIVTEESLLKRERQQKDGHEVPIWSSGDQQVEPSEEAVYQREEMSLKEAALLPSKRDVTSPSEITHPTKKDVSRLPSKKEVLACKKTCQERKFKEAYDDEEIEETVYVMEEVVKTKISATSEEVTVIKQADSATVEEVASERFMPRRETVSPPPQQDLLQITPKAILPHAMTVVPPKQEVITPVSEEVSFEKEHVPATVSPPTPAQSPAPEKVVCPEEDISPPKGTVLPAKETSPALPIEVFAPKEDFLPEEMSLPRKPITQDKVAPAKKPEAPPQKKLLPPEEESLQSKKSASLAQKTVAPKVDSSEEARTTATKPPPTRQDDKKAKKGTVAMEHQTLQKGILYYLSCTDP